LPLGACTEDITCQLQKGDYRATCVDEVCTLPCAFDIDCNPGLTDGNLTQVCDDGMCKDIGCTDDGECANATDVANLVEQPRKMFCRKPAAGTPTVTGVSAITD
jgi:hypothetical protein